MPVEVVLIRATELEQVVALQHAHIIAEHVVFSIPEAGTRLLRIHVVGSQNVVPAFAERLKRAAQACKLQVSPALPHCQKLRR